MPQRHEIPTHLGVEDRAFYGLTMRQVMYLTAGLSGGYSRWNQWPGLQLLIRATLAAVCVLLALTFALVRPHGRSLDEWLFVVLHHAALPKTSVWRPREPDDASWQPVDGSWEELTPQIAWREERA